MDVLALVISVLIALYPLLLIWRFLRLGIKAFKKYLSEQPEKRTYDE